MKIIKNLNKIKDNPKPCSITIGNFDGIHKGHRELIMQTVNLSKKYNLIPTVMSFDPFPEEHFNVPNFFRLMNHDDKIDAFNELGIKQVILLPFTKEFSQIEAERFISDILIKKLNTKKITVGEEFKFGYRRKGDWQLLNQNKKFSLSKIDILSIANNKIGSSYIRKLLIDGEINQANQLLKKPFAITGIVVHGEKRGRKLGYPTANIEIYKSHPINGIFLVEVLIDNKDKHHGLASIGNKPTFSGKNDVLEVFIFDFDSDIYKKNLKVYFIEKIREQIKFKDGKNLKIQMNKDYKNAIQILNKINGL
tara:strand:- start:1122 stop:2045 length:924 start_codon:yes stop_codon:yes gene_type:complete